MMFANGFFEMRHRLAGFAVFIVLLAGARADAATINASSCSYEDVQRAVGLAIDGDTVIIPSGTCTWTKQLTITKGIRLQGSGIDVTIIRDNVKKGAGTPNPRLLHFTVNQPNTFELAHLTIEGVATDPNLDNQGHVGLSGTAKTFRVHDVKFLNHTTSAIRIFGYLFGVIDHCEFIANRRQSIIVGHPTWGGHSYGDGSWAEELSLGTHKAIYIEDNVFRELSSDSAVGAFDAMDGARVVFRYNKVYGKDVATHGTESSQRRRSIRSFEIYNNEFDRTAYKTGWFTAIYIRGGTGVIFNNVIKGRYDRTFVLANYRTNSKYTPWGKCDGTSPYDLNTAGQFGYRCVDQPGSGTSRLLSGAVPTATPVNNTLDPIYIWDNNPNSGSSQSFHIMRGRDYIVGEARPGYTPYVYPHPLVSDRARPKSPQNLRLIVH
jgi:hypothetical protein